MDFAFNVVSWIVNFGLTKMNATATKLNFQPIGINRIQLIPMPIECAFLYAVPKHDSCMQSLYKQHIHAGA